MKYVHLYWRFKNLWIALGDGSDPHKLYQVRKNLRTFCRLADKPLLKQVLSDIEKRIEKAEMKLEDLRWARGQLQEALSRKQRA